MDHRAAPPAPLQYRDRARYDILAEHGRGGLGRVSRAHDRELGREVAIKELLHRGYTTEARFFREALITARLEHPSIVPVHEAGRWPDGTPFYAMKLVAGRPLKQLLDEAATLADRLALLPKVIAVAEAIVYAHDRRIIHRDLKPSNVIVGDFGETVVIDWGLAKDLTDQVPEDPGTGPFRAPADLGLTVAGSVLGTPAYMAPEQRAGCADERADVYALGGILHHVLTGRPPHAPTEPRALDVDPDRSREAGGETRATKVVVAGGVGVGVGGPVPAVDAPRDLLAIAARALEASPERRYPTALAFAEDLRRFQNGRLVSARAYSRGEIVRRWIALHRTVVALTAAAATMLVVGGAIAIRRVVTERDLAELAQRRAVVARRDTEVALAASERSRDRLVLTNARAALDRDPTAALAWLKTYRGPDDHAVTDIAAVAVGLGVARRVLAGHDGAVYAVAPQPDGDSVVTASVDQSLRRWDLRTGSNEVIHRQLATNTRVATSRSGRRTAIVSADGRLAISRAGRAGLEPVAAEVGTVELLAFVGEHMLLVQQTAAPYLRLVPLDGGPVPTALGGIGGRVGTSAASADGSWIASCGYDGDLVVWAVGRGRPRFRGGCRDAPWPLSFSADGRLLGVAAPSGSFVLDTARLALRRMTPTDRAIEAIELSTSGRWLAEGTADGDVRVVDTASGTDVARWHHGSAVTRLAFSDDERRVIAASADGEVRVLDRASGLTSRLRGHQDAVLDLRCRTPTCSRLLTASGDGTIRDWVVPEVAPTLLSGPGAGALMATFAGADRIVGISLDGRVRAWERAGRGWTTRTLFRHAAIPNHVVSSPDGTLVATSDVAGGLHTWDPRTGSIFRRLHETAITGIAITRDGFRVAAVGAGGDVQIFDPAIGAVDAVGRHGSAITDVLVLEPSGDLLAAGTDGVVVRWAATTPYRQIRSDVAHAGFIPDMADLFDGSAVTIGADGLLERWSSDASVPSRTLAHRSVLPRVVAACGGHVVSTWRDGVVRFDAIDTGASFALSIGASRVSELACARRTGKLAVATEDGRLRLLDLATFSERILVASDPSSIRSLQFSPDESTLLSTTTDGTVRLWRVDGALTPRRGIERWLDVATTATIEPEEEERP